MFVAFTQNVSNMVALNFCAAERDIKIIPKVRISPGLLFSEPEKPLLIISTPVLSLHSSDAQVPQYS